MVYRLRFQPWWVSYRYRDAAGNWTPIHYVSNQYYVDQPDVIQDTQGRAHIFYCGGTGTPWDGPTDIWETVNTGGTWSYNKLTPTTDNRAYPRAAMDANGMIHLVHIAWLLAYGVQGSVMYRMQTPTGWTDDINIGHICEVWYHHPDISIDGTSNVHVVWVDSGGTHHRLMYRRKSPNAIWSAPQMLGTTTGSKDSFFYPKVAWAGGNNLIVAVQQNSTIWWTCSMDGGQTWSTFAQLAYGEYPNLETDPLGGVHLVYSTQSTYGIAYRKWTTAGWGDQLQITPNTYWQLSPDVTVDTYNQLHVVYEDNLYNTNKHLISYINAPQDTTPPSAVIGFVVTPSDGAAFAKWTNPSNSDFTGTMIRRKVGSAPTSVTDGDLVTQIPAAPGSTCTCNDPGLANGTIYYYSAFPHDASYNYASPTQTRALPTKISSVMAKLVDDGSWVTLAGRVVTGVFAGDGCTYVEDPARTGGIRLAGIFSGIAVGDIVNVSGNLSTTKPDGVSKSERYISSPTVTKISPNSPVAPLDLTCGSAGGGPLGAFAVGAQHGLGLNNMGLLVKISGRVTMRISKYIYIDDGSNVADTMGRIGVMVQCPDTSIPVNVDDYVSACGVVVGSMPVGWTTNRRMVEIRSYSDLHRFGSVSGP